eukprot:217308-Chlamydomonas_euryale.AAC.1
MLGSGGVGPRIGSTLFHWGRIDAAWVVNTTQSASDPRRKTQSEFIPSRSGGPPPDRLVWRRDWVGSDARLAPRPGQRHQGAELPAIFSAIA